MVKRLVTVFLAVLLAVSPAVSEQAINPAAPTPSRIEQPPPPEPRGPTTKEILTDVAIIALIIAASVAAYKSMGKPCACPNDTMRNGRLCGGNSAYVKPGGYKPLCYPTDITAAMISAYRAKNVVPALR